MTREEAAANLLQYLKENEKHGSVWATSLDLAISALREQPSPRAACGYGGKHLDAPPCTTCPAHPKLESNLKVVESTEQSEAVTKCNDLYDEDGGEVFSRPESDTVKVVDSDQFARNLHNVASNQQVTEPLCCKGFSGYEPLFAIKNQVKSDLISVEERLPEVEGSYLTYTDEGRIIIDSFCIYPDHGTKFWVGGNGRVTHWMPLPEPPKEEER